MQFNTIGFIGCGNMGGALAQALPKGEHNVFLANRTQSKADALALKIGAAVTDNQTIAKTCDLIFLGVKPQMMPGVLAELADTFAGRPTPFVLAGGAYPVIRIMPNTPVSLGAGMILYCADGVAQEDLDAFCTLMAGAGRLDVLPESLIDAGCAISGCGPAYVYLFIEALADGGVACGLPRDKAMTYAAQTLMGAAELVLESGSHPGALKDAVCSPGGSTIQGVRALEMGGFRSTAMEAVLAAYEKTRELGKKED